MGGSRSGLSPSAPAAPSPPSRRLSTAPTASPRRPVARSCASPPSSATRRTRAPSSCAAATPGSSAPASPSGRPIRDSSWTGSSRRPPLWSTRWCWPPPPRTAMWPTGCARCCSSAARASSWSIPTSPWTPWPASWTGPRRSSSAPAPSWRMLTRSTHVTTSASRCSSITWSTPGGAASPMWTAGRRPPRGDASRGSARPWRAGGWGEARGWCPGEVMRTAAPGRSATSSRPVSCPRRSCASTTTAPSVLSWSCAVKG